VDDPLHVSDDDLAVAAGKDKLATLRDRPGFADAMRPVPRGSRKPQIIFLVLGLGLSGLALQSCSEVSASWLGVLRVDVLIVAALFTWLLAIGSSPDAPAVAWPVVVLAKPEGATVSKRLVLLRDDGTTVTTGANDTLYGMLRPGDAGVAHVRNAAMAADPAQLVIAFHRL
jgi:hypothetical protein